MKKGTFQYVGFRPSRKFRSVLIMFPNELKEGQILKADNGDIYTVRGDGSIRSSKTKKENWHTKRRNRRLGNGA